MGQVGVALLVLGWLTPEHFLPWVSWHAEVPAFAAVVAVAIAAAAASWRREGRTSFQVPFLAAPLLLMGAIALVQIATGRMTFFGDAVTFCCYVLLGVTCVALGFNTPAVSPEIGGRWSPPQWLALALLAGALASVLVALAQVFELWENSAWVLRQPELRRPGGNLGQPNQLATLLLMGVASAAFLHVGGKLGGAIAAILILILCGGLAMTESRAGVIGFLALFLWWQCKRGAVASRVSIWAAPVLAAVFLAMYFAWPLGLSALQLTDSGAQNRFTHGDVRLAMWSQLLDAIWQKPWAGWGILEVAKAHNAVADTHPINNPFSYSHNLFIDLAIWMGLPVAALLALLAAAWAWRRLRTAATLLPWYCLAVAIPMATHSLLEFPYAYAYFLAPVLYLLGVLERSLGARCWFRLGVRTATALLVAWGAVLLWSGAEYLAIEEDFRIVRFEQLRIGKTPDHQQQPQVVLLTQLGALLTGSRINLGSGMAPDQLDQLRKLALRYPWVATQYRYALALALNGNPQEATRQLQVLRWQRDEKTYGSIKREIAELAQTRYPPLLALKLP